MTIRDLKPGTYFVCSIYDSNDIPEKDFRTTLLLRLEQLPGENDLNAVRVNDGRLIKVPEEAQVVRIY